MPSSPQSPRRYHASLSLGYVLFLDKLFQTRVAHAVSEEELARRLTVTVEAVRQCESGHSVLDFLQTRAWLAAIGAPLHEFCVELDALLSTIDGLPASGILEGEATTSGVTAGETANTNALKEVALSPAPPPTETFSPPTMPTHMEESICVQEFSGIEDTSNDNPFAKCDTREGFVPNAGVTPLDISNMEKSNTQKSDTQKSNTTKDKESPNTGASASIENPPFIENPPSVEDAPPASPPKELETALEFEQFEATGFGADRVSDQCVSDQSELTLLHDSALLHVLVLLPDERPFLQALPDTLEAMQARLGEEGAPALATTFSTGIEGCIGVAGSEAFLRRLPLNFVVPATGTAIFGTGLLVGDASPGFRSLSPLELERCLDAFAPQISQAEFTEIIRSHPQGVQWIEQWE